MNIKLTQKFNTLYGGVDVPFIKGNLYLRTDAADPTDDTYSTEGRLVIATSTTDVVYLDDGTYVKNTGNSYIDVTLQYCVTEAE